MVGLKTLVNRKCSKMGSHHITLNIANKMTSGDFTMLIKTFNLNKAIGPDSIAVNAKQI